MKQTTAPVIITTLLSVGLSAFLITEFLNYSISEPGKDNTPIITQIEVDTEPGPHTQDPPLQNPLLGINTTFISAGTTSTVQKHIQGRAFIVNDKNET